MEHEIVIIGAGAASISLALKLKEQSKNFVILERGDVPGYSWAKMPDHLKLISTWRANSIKKEDPNRYPRSYRMKALEYQNYLQMLSELNELPIQYQCRVDEISFRDNQYVIDSTLGDIHAKKIIMATGYFSNPIIPDQFLAAKMSIPIIPFSHFKNANELKRQGHKKVLVVGKRLSAGQIVHELISENIGVSLSSRSPVQFMSSMPIFNFLFKFLIELESIILFIKKDLKKKLDIKMESGIIKSHFTQKEVQLFGDVKTVSDRFVTFQNGEVEEFDAIILTTGFRPAFNLIKGIKPFETNELINSFEHPNQKNLFFLGLDQQYNFRSRFLRGMREDARLLANLL